MRRHTVIALTVAAALVATLNTFGIAPETPVVSATSAPTITGSATHTRTENGSLAVGDYTAVDSGGNSIGVSGWSVQGTDRGDFSVREVSTDSNGVVTISLDFRNTPNFEAPADANGDNNYEVTLRVTDGTSASTLDVTVTVTNVNEPPYFIGKYSVPYAEQVTLEGYGSARIRMDGNYGAEDPEGDWITFTLSGADADRFLVTYSWTERKQRHIHLALDSSTNLDYERPEDANQDGVYEVTIRAADATGFTELDVTLTVLDVNELHTLTGPSGVSFPTGGTGTVATYKVTDPDNATIPLTLGGTDAASFNLNSGALTFKSAPDYQTKSSYEVTVTAADGTHTVSRNVTVSVVNSQQTMTLSGAGSYSIREDATSLSLGTYTATTSGGGQVAWSVEGTDATAFSISADGGLRLNSWPDYEARSSYAAKVKASSATASATMNVTVTVTDVDEPPGLKGPLAVSFPSGGTGVVATFSAIDPDEGQTAELYWYSHYSNDTDNPSFNFNTYTGELTFKSPPDYDTRSAYVAVITVEQRTSSGYREIPHRVAVTILPDQLSLSGSRRVSIEENATDLSLGSYRAANAGGETVTWSLEGPDRTMFVLSAGALSLKAAPDYETRSSYSVTVKATAGTKTATVAVAVTVNDVDEGPTITSGGAAHNYAENGTAAVATYAATDPESDAIAWTVEGTDAGDFRISSSGVLSFASTPDYESPADADIDNRYQVAVKATANGKSATRDVTVTVTNVADTPMPGRVTVLTATATDHSTVSLTWQAPGGGATVTGYRILRRAVASERSFQTLSQDTGTTSTTWTDSGVSSRTRYAYRVRALGEHGAGRFSTLASVITPAPPAPGQATRLTATAAAHNTVSLSWNAPGDGGTVTGYQILRRNLGSDDGLQVLVQNTGSTGTTYTDSSVTARTRYSYRVRALGDQGQGAISNFANVTTPVAPVPGRVTGLTATVTEDNTVSLSWNAPGSGGAVTGYQILRRNLGSEDRFQVLVQDTDNTGVTWTDSSVSTGTRYSYRVRALGEHRDGTISAPAAVTIPE